MVGAAGAVGTAGALVTVGVADEACRIGGGRGWWGEHGRLRGEIERGGDGWWASGRQVVVVVVDGWWASNEQVSICGPPSPGR